jgi:hypothetical protein
MTLVPQNTGPLVKIAFYYEGGTETMWAEQLGHGKYRLDNSPFYIYGISHNDIFAAISADGRLEFSAIESHEGHSTYRVRLQPGDAPDVFLQHWQFFADSGCAYEGVEASQYLFTLDIPRGVPVEPIYRELERIEDLGIWEFEEAHFYKPKADER